MMLLHIEVSYIWFTQEGITSWISLEKKKFKEDKYDIVILITFQCNLHLDWNHL